MLPVVIEKNMLKMFYNFLGPLQIAESMFYISNDGNSDAIIKSAGFY